VKNNALIQADFKRLVKKYHKVNNVVLVRWYFTKYQMAGGKSTLMQILGVSK